MRHPIAALLRAAAAILVAVPLALPAADTLVAEAPPVGPFDRVRVSGDAEVVLVQGDREAVTVEASPKSRAKVRVRSQDGRLSIDAGERGSWSSMFSGGSARRPTVTVYFRNLSALDVSGTIKVTAARLDSPAVRITASGAATIHVEALNTDDLRFAGSGAVKGELAGTAAEQRVTISGAGDYRASRLVADDATVRVSGAGKVVVNARKTLDATISGAGVIEYYGDPEVRQRVSGAGRIVRRSADAVAMPLRAA
jgi:hypothetical protein